MIPRPLLAALLLPLCALATAAQQRSPIPRSALFADPPVTAIRLCPDGVHVGYLLPDSRGTTQLWMVEADRPDAPVQITADTSVPLVRWHPLFDNRHLLLVRHGEEGDRLTLFDLASRTEVDRTPAAGSSIQIAALSPKLPDRVVVSVQNSTGVQLLRVNLTDGSAEEIPGLDRFDQWLFDADLQPRAARGPAPGGFAHYRFTSEGPEVINISSGFAEIRSNGLVSVSSDGKQIYLIDNHGRDRAALKSVETRTGRERLLAEDSLADLLPGGATIDPVSGVPQAVVGYYVRMRRHILDPSISGDFERLRSVHPGDVSFVGQSLDGKRWLVRYMNGGPLDYYLYDRTTGEARFLFNDMPGLAGYQLATRRPLIVRARDGVSLPCDVYLPAGSDRDSNGVPDHPLPTVLYVHGGPWVGSEWNLWLVNRNFQLLADRGYAVIRTDFRGANGYGRTFMDAGDREWAGAMRRDLLDIAARAAKLGITDRSKTAMWGWSYGGYATFAALAMTPDSFACGISMYGVSDLARFESEHIERNGRAAIAEWFTRVGDVTTPKGRELLRQHSPLTYVAKITKPLLVTHGSRDQMVPQEQSDTIVARLRELGRPVTYMIYPNEPHDYRRPESWESFWGVAERFLHEHLGGRYQPYTDEMARATVKVTTGAKFVQGLEEVVGRN